MHSSSPLLLSCASLCLLAHGYREAEVGLHFTQTQGIKTLNKAVLSAVNNLNPHATKKKKQHLKDLNAFHFSPAEASVGIDDYLRQRAKSICYFGDLGEAAEAYDENADKGPREFRKCEWYTGESSTYSELRTEGNACDRSKMRLCDIVATDNPVIPRREQGVLHVLWEARSSESVISKLLCPETEEFGQQQALVVVKNNLNVLTYGGEAEVKYLKVLIGDKQAAHDALYAQPLLEFYLNGEKIARMEAEGANGVGKDLWVEFVTEALKVKSFDFKTKTMKVLRALWNTIFEYEGGTLEAMAKKLSTGELEVRALATKDKSGASPVDLSPAEVSIKNVNKAKVRFSTVCQGNFNLPLTKVSEPEFANYFKIGTNQRAWGQTMKETEKLVAAIDKAEPKLSGQDRAELKGTLAIHLWNSLMISKVDTRDDTMKNLWDLLPKAPVVDLVRAWTPATKEKFLKWMGPE